MSRIVASGRQSRDGGVLLGLYTEAGLGFVLFLYIGLVLPESLPAARQRRQRLAAPAAGSEESGVVGTVERKSGIQAAQKQPLLHAASSRLEDSNEDEEGEAPPTCGRRNNVLSALSYLFCGRSFDDKKSPSSFSQLTKPGPSKRPPMISLAVDGSRPSSC